MKKGFTLIELLVVVLIMGILASVALPQYFISVEKARSAEAIAVLSAIASAEDRHYMKTGKYARPESPELDIQATVKIEGSKLVSTYFYYEPVQFSATDLSMSLYAYRKENVGGVLGKYRIALFKYGPPRNQTWLECYPRPVCNSFLPKAGER